MVCDIHERDSFGVAKVSVPQDIHYHSAIVLDQINARHVDETMLGSYEYIPI